MLLVKNLLTIVTLANATLRLYRTADKIKEDKQPQRTLSIEERLRNNDGRVE
jgi:hypothetical protein